MVEVNRKAFALGREAARERAEGGRKLAAGA
jgi:hypothetical protein